MGGQQLRMGGGRLGMLAASAMEWRARRIADPVQRLRFLRRTTTTLSARAHSRRLRHVVALGVPVVALSLIPSPSVTSATGLERPGIHLRETVAREAADPPHLVWLVEQNPSFEVYSNGLRIETQHVQSNRPRRYRPLPRQRPSEWTQHRPLDVEHGTKPAGIVFHTTESDLAPFEPSQNKRLQILARGVLDWVRQEKSYHYLVDRFGRVYRVVKEDDVANHAGWSVWADATYVYVNLNESFLGVAFEAQTRPEGGGSTINEAQRHSGRVLTQMLRSKYRIAGRNCVTHAQVSVNPDNLRIGAHTDWAVGFPFGEMGLPDNYGQPLPSMTLFGFTYDRHFLTLSDASLWKGLLLAEDEVRQAASAEGMKVSRYKEALNRRYRETIETLKKHRREET